MSPNPPCFDCFVIRELFNKHASCLRCRDQMEKAEPQGREFIPHAKVHSHRGHAEQLGRYGGPGSRKFEKKRAARLRRRAEKLDPANAPTRLIRGWND